VKLRIQELEEYIGERYETTDLVSTSLLFNNISLGLKG
jgi:hypothetical protein